MTVPVIVVEDEPLVRDLVRAALARAGPLEVVGAFADAPTALARAPALRPRVAVLDIDLGRGMNGIQLGRRLRREIDGLGIVLLSHHEDLAYLAAAPPAELAGWAYVLKRSLGDPQALLRAVESAAAGLVALDAHLIRRAAPRPTGLLSGLGPRLRGLLDLVAQGFSDAAIAERLALSPDTVQAQIDALCQALGVAPTGGAPPRVAAVLRLLEETGSRVILGRFGGA